MEIVLGLSSLSFPASSEELYGREAPLVVEIGVGSGTFLHDLAVRRPDLNVLGIDRAPQSIARSYRRLRRGGVRNARLLKGDARWVIRNVIPPGGLSRAYVNFPDPWPRKKHRHRRLLQHSFLRLLSSRLGPDGELLVTTDHEAYFAYVLDEASKAGCCAASVCAPPREVFVTKWARKASSYFHAVLTPTGPLDHDLPDVKLTDTMYHAVLTGALPDLSTFEKRTFRGRHGVVVLLDVYRPLERPGLAFLAHVEEDGLSQEVIIEVREGKQGFVTGVRRFGEPLHTRGLSAAVRATVDWLVDQGMTVIHKKY